MFSEIIVIQLGALLQADQPYCKPKEFKKYVLAWTINDEDEHFIQVQLIALNSVKRRRDA